MLCAVGYADELLFDVKHCQLSVSVAFSWRVKYLETVYLTGELYKLFDGT